MKVGLITYHSAYNFGSVLQAYATQQILDRLGYDNEIIDYRTPSQTNMYNTDIVTDGGVRALLKTIGFYRKKAERKQRKEKYDDFINRYLRLSSQTYTSYKEIQEHANDYPILIVGSDQVWNKGVGEFRHEGPDAIKPYFLQFGKPQKRIAFSSSMGERSINYAYSLKNDLSQLDIISIREPVGARFLSKVLDKKIQQVCDPTWLLSKEEWDIDGVYKPNFARPYILVYTLHMGNKDSAPWLEVLKEYAAKKGYEVVCVSPITSISHKGVKSIDHAGPLDILSYIKHAELVLTNTFHGTVFSMNCETPFFSMNARMGSRQQQMLEIGEFETRIVHSPADLRELISMPCDFSIARVKIEEQRKKSIEFLKQALES